MRVRGERREPREERRSPPPRARAQGSWLSFFTGLAVGLSVAVLEWFWFQQTPLGIPRDAAAPNVHVAPLPGDLAEAPETIREAPASPPAPTFDFFTVLPDTEVKVSDMEVPVDEDGPVPGPEEAAEAAEAVSAVTEGPPEAVPTGPAYMLQVGSFQSAADADQSKALLALQGVQASVQQVAINGQAWFRVHVGPFADLTRAQQTRSRLDQLGIRAIVLKVGGNPP